MKIRLSHSEVIIGAEDDINKSLLLDLLPLSHSAHTLASGEVITANFCALAKSDDRTSRMILLLQRMLDKLQNNKQIDFVNTPIFWLLPNIDLDDKSKLSAVAKQFKVNFPFLFQHSLSQSFAYGRCAISHALSKAKQLFSEKNISAVYLLSVDSLFHEVENLQLRRELLNPDTGDGMIPSEGVIFSVLENDNEGLNIDFVAHDAAVKEQMTTCTESLLLKSSQYLQGTMKNANLNKIYLPGNGQPALIDNWLAAYHRLASIVCPQTKTQQMGLFTGELGCNSGLYNLLHIYQGYQQQTIQGYTLQLEIAEQLHQGVILYSWKQGTMFR